MSKIDPIFEDLVHELTHSKPKDYVSSLTQVRHMMKHLEAQYGEDVLRKFAHSSLRPTDDHQPQKRDF